MFPTPYVYGVDNIYPVDDMLCTVETYSVGIWCGNPDHMLWGVYDVDIWCGNNNHILWVTYAVDICCGRHSMYCGSHECIYTVDDIV